MGLLQDNLVLSTESGSKSTLCHLRGHTLLDMNVVPQSTMNTTVGNGRSNLEVVGSIPTEVKRIFSLPRVVPLFPLLGLTPSGSFMGFTGRGALLLIGLMFSLREGTGGCIALCTLIYSHFLSRNYFHSHFLYCKHVHLRRSVTFKSMDVKSSTIFNLAATKSNAKSTQKNV